MTRQMAFFSIRVCIQNYIFKNFIPCSSPGDPIWKNTNEMLKIRSFSVFLFSCLSISLIRRSHMEARLESTAVTLKKMHF